MAFDWQEYLLVTRYLSGGSFPFSREAAARTAVSRAYYAAFHHALTYAVRHLRFEPQGRAADHGALMARFRERNMRPLADGLRRLRGWREQCDYDDEVANLPVILAAAMEQAESIRSRLP